MNKELLYTFFQGKTTLDEEVRIREWMESTPENYRTFLEERKLFDAMILLADEKRLLSKRNQFKLLVSTWGKEIGKIAAVAIITLVMTLTSQYIFNNEDMIPLQKLSVPAGQRINIELADGTVVWLNSRTSIQYPAVFNGKERKVSINGEAYFEVAHNKKQPFIVETPKGQVEVTGTKFYVEAYSDNDDFVTSLIEGSVNVTKDDKLITLRPSQMAYLQDGNLRIDPSVPIGKDDSENVEIERFGEPVVPDFEIPYHTEIMEKFERHYGVTIKIENKEVLNYRCSGKFRYSDGISYALRVLQKDVKFKFHRDENSDIIHIK